MELSSTWEASSFAISQEPPSILLNPKFHYSAHKSPHWYLSWAGSIQSIPSHPIEEPFNIVLVFLVVSFLLAFPPISYVNSSSPAFVLHAVSNSSSFTWRSHYIWRRVQFMKLFIMQISPTSCHSSIWCKYSPEYPVLKHPQAMFLS
jgi:hypothetical protein